MTVPRSPGRWTIALAGAIALAIAMGIGRFAFTPLLPMMLHDGVIDLHGASWLASANYLGYLGGALLCTFQPWIWARVPGLPAIKPSALLRGGLVATALLTMGMAVPVAAAWPLWRFAAGIASAVVFVYTSGWCLTRLASMNQASLGAAIYTGPGIGIVISGVFATGMVQWGWTAQAGWVIFGLLAAGLAAAVWRVFRGEASAQVPVAAPTAPAAAGGASGAPRHGGVEIAFLAFGYGLAGFGYIVTATFLPVIARQALPGSPWLDLFWPVFGLGVMIGPLIATRLPTTLDQRALLAVCHVVQAIGIVIGIWSPSLAGFALGSLLLGIPFTAITFFAIQEIRRLRPLQAASFMGLITVLYGLGQIAGPPMVALVLRHSATTGAGFTLALEIAAGGLLLGAATYLVMLPLWPTR